MMTSWQIAILVIVVLIAFYLYSKTEHFEGGNSKPFLVLFGQDWCPACREFKPTWDKLQTIPAITDVVNLVQLDPLPFNVSSYPTIRFYKRDPKQYPEEFVVYSGNRNLGSLMKFVRENAF
jgi:thiol-disulfide isomerase/thioredoxin